MRLTSWQERGLTWGPLAELTGLQTCIQNMIENKIKLVTVVQVMLVRQVLLCQRRTYSLCEFEPAKHQTLLELFGTTHEEIWKVLFKAGETPPPPTEDRGLSLKRQPNLVSFFNVFRKYPLLAYFEEKLKLPSFTFRPGLSWPRRLTVRLRYPRTRRFHYWRRCCSPRLMRCRRRRLRRRAKGPRKTFAGEALRTRRPRARLPLRLLTTAMKRKKKATPLLKRGGRRERPPRARRRKRLRGLKAPLRITPHGTSTAVRSDLAGPSLGPLRKYQNSQKSGLPGLLY